MSLHLDFSLKTQPERVKFIESYILSHPNLSQDDLDMMGKYILWGVDPSTNLNGAQSGIDLEPRHKTWTTQHDNSLEELLENPTFNENSLSPLGSNRWKVPRPNFSRSETRSTCPPSLLPDFEALWKRIDRTEYKVQKWELQNNKRSLPIRDQLLQSISSEIQELDSIVQKLSVAKYLKLKHELVQLRTEQYILKDCYAPIVYAPASHEYIETPALNVGSEIGILPLGLYTKDGLFEKVFPIDQLPNPQDFSIDDLRRVSKILWEVGNFQSTIDFTNPEHVRPLLKLYNEFQEFYDRALEDDRLASWVVVFRILNAYISYANLQPQIRKILELKLAGKSNEVIVKEIWKLYGKKYSANYISTIYKQKCVQAICVAAKNHRKIMENIFFKENFKKCRVCGEMLLLDEEYFAHDGRSQNGFSSRCKRCDRKKRKGGKKINEDA